MMQFDLVPDEPNHACYRLCPAVMPRCDCSRHFLQPTSTREFSDPDTLPKGHFVQRHTLPTPFQPNTPLAIPNSKVTHRECIPYCASLMLL